MKGLVHPVRLRGDGQRRGMPSLRQKSLYSADYGEFWKIERKETLARDGYRCTYPGCTEKIDRDNPLQVHHRIVSRAKGGSNGKDNCVTLCKFHHMLTHNRKVGRR